MNAPADTLIPYLQRRAGRALAEVFQLEQDLIRKRMALDHAVMALKEVRELQLRSGKVAK